MNVRATKKPTLFAWANRILLRFLNCTYGALSGARSAIYTEIGIDFALFSDFADCFTRANTDAVFTSDTIVTYFVSHSYVLLSKNS